MIELAAFIVSTVIVVYAGVMLAGLALAVAGWAIVAVAMPFVWAAKGLRWMYAAAARVARRGLPRHHRPPEPQPLW